MVSLSVDCSFTALSCSTGIALIRDNIYLYIPPFGRAWVGSFLGRAWVGYFITNDMPGLRPSSFSTGRALTSKVFRSYWPLAFVAFQTA